MIHVIGLYWVFTDLLMIDFVIVNDFKIKKINFYF